LRDGAGILVIVHSVSKDFSEGGWLNHDNLERIGKGSSISSLFFLLDYFVFIFVLHFVFSTFR
jgi:hypothetical protein